MQYNPLNDEPSPRCKDFRFKIAPKPVCHHFEVIQTGRFNIPKKNMSLQLSSLLIL